MRSIPVRPLSLALLSVLFAAPARAQLADAQPTASCPPALKDAAQPSACIPASSVPTQGALLPLGPELFVAPTGEVGIGNLFPEHALDVAGNLRAERCAFGGGSIGPLPNWDWLFDFSATISDFPTANYYSEGMTSWITVDPDHDLTGPDLAVVQSHDFYVNIPTGNDKDIYSVSGTFILAEHNGTGTLGYLYAGATEAWARDGRVERMSGAYLNAHAFGTAIVIDNRAVQVQSGQRESSSVQDDYGVFIHSPYTNGALANHYGLFLEDQDFGQQDSYAIYSEGGTTYLAGDLGVGTATPSAKLDVAGDLVASGTKSFVEPHPLDPTKEIRFVCLEGNEAGTYFRGTARLVDGAVTIRVPEEFALVTEPEGLTVQLTPLGPGGDLWVASRGLGWIEVRGARDVAFDYLVNGVRRGYADFEVVRKRVRRTSQASRREASAPELRVHPERRARE